MHTELPTFKRCCFCLPLRYGLIFWGYLKLVFSGLVTTGFSIMFVQAIKYINSEELRYKVEPFNLVVMSLAVLIAFSDIILNLIFVIGCHKKNVKIMQIYYKYSLFLLALIVLMSLYIIGLSLYFTRLYPYSLRSFIFDFMEALSMFANVALQGYIILLVRSEIDKLNNGCQFRFVNNAADAECTLNVEEVQKYNEKNAKQHGNDGEGKV